jgi:HAD superfamily hydrolase (TIGR01509 family)
MRQPDVMPEPGAAQAVIFDMDGVLTDSEPLINAAAVAAFRELRLAVEPEDFLPFVGAGEDRYLGGVAEKHGYPIDLPSLKRRTYEIYLERVPTQLEAFPGACELVRSCRSAGLRLAVASSADRIKVEANLRKIGLPPEFWDVVVTGETVANKKPAPDIFLKAAEQLGVPPAQCVVVEDAVNGVQAARAAGIPCVAVAQSFSAELLRDADAVVPRIADLEVDRLLKVPTAARASTYSAMPAVVPEAAVVGAQWPSARPWGFWATLGLSLAVAAAVLASELGLSVVLATAVVVGGQGEPAPSWVYQQGLLWSLATLISTPLLVGLTLLFAWMRRGLSVREYLALRGLRKRTLVRWCLGLFAFALVSDSLTWLLGKPIVPDVMIEAYRTSVWPGLLWVAVVVCAPWGEEIFFRGFLFKGWLHSPLGGWGTVLLTSLIWAVIHLQYDLYGVATIFVGGLLLGYARLRTGSLYPPILMHTLMNVLAMVQTAFFA